MNPEASAHWPLARWILRAALAGMALLFLARLVPGRRQFAAHVPPALLGAGALLQLLNLAMFVGLPVSRTPHQAALVAAARWTAAHHPGRDILGSSPWISFAIDAVRPVDVPHPWEEFEWALPGTLYLCDVSEPDSRLAQGARPIAFYERAATFRRVPLPDSGCGRIALFEKLR